MARKKPEAPGAKADEQETFGTWLTKEMDDWARVSAAELSRMSGGEITDSNISYWRKDRSGITSENAIFLAQLLWSRQPEGSDRDAAEFLVKALTLAGHTRGAALINPETARTLMASTQEHESIQILRASHLPEDEKEDFINIAQRRLDRLTRQSRSWVADAGENGDAA